MWASPNAPPPCHRAASPSCSPAAWPPPRPAASPPCDPATLISLSGHLPFLPPSCPNLPQPSRPPPSAPRSAPAVRSRHPDLPLWRPHGPAAPLPEPSAAQPPARLSAPQPLRRASPGPTPRLHPCGFAQTPSSFQPRQALGLEPNDVVVLIALTLSASQGVSRVIRGSLATRPPSLVPRPESASVGHTGSATLHGFRRVIMEALFNHGRVMQRCGKAGKWQKQQ